MKVDENRPKRHIALNTAKFECKNKVATTPFIHEYRANSGLHMCDKANPFLLFSWAWGTTDRQRHLKSKNDSA